MDRETALSVFLPCPRNKASSLAAMKGEGGGGGGGGGRDLLSSTCHENDGGWHGLNRATETERETLVDHDAK